MFLVKFLVYFVISFGILCIPLSNRPLFTYLHKFTAPMWSDIKQTTTNGIRNTQKLGHKMFSDAVPTNDILGETSSAPTRDLKHDKAPDDTYTQEERALLNKILENHR